MKESKRIISALIVFVMLIGALIASRNNTLDERQVESYDDDSLVIWYTDDNLTDYLNTMAVEFHELKGIRVVPRLKEGGDFIESIYMASMEDGTTPDMYIIGSDSLEKAYMSGCAALLTDNGYFDAAQYPASAVSAVTYHNNPVAYPLYFETTALLYNKTYLTEIASNIVNAETAKTPDDESSGDSPDSDSTDSEETEEQEAEQAYYDSLSIEDKIAYRVDKSIPVTFDDLLNFADNFDAPEGVETIFKWDVRDIFYNYFFVGEYIDMGGADGDNPDEINVYNLDAINAMLRFQEMNQFFSFESEDVTYDQVKNEFLEGKMVFATVTTDAVKLLREKSENKEFKYEYGFTSIPDLSEDMSTKSLSETTAIVINGYSDDISNANEFAGFLAITKADSLYEMTGKFPAVSGVFGEDDAEYAFVEEYEVSSPMPKMMATSNSWLLMEGTFSDVWSGADVSHALQKLSEQIKHQISGEDVKEDFIPLPKEEEEVEYLDEEALKQEAQSGEN